SGKAPDTGDDRAPRPASRSVTSTVARELHPEPAAGHRATVLTMSPSGQLTPEPGRPLVHQRAPLLAPPLRDEPVADTPPVLHGQGGLGPGGTFQLAGHDRSRFRVAAFTPSGGPKCPPGASRGLGSCH